MACKLPHSVEQVQNYVKKQVEIDDKERQDAIVEVIKKFELAKLRKDRLRTRYEACKDISVERKYVIDQFLYNEFRKDADVVETLWGCVQQIKNEKSNKIRWSFEENVQAADTPQQQQQFVHGASSSSAPSVVEPQQQQLHLDNFQLSFEENAKPADDGWNSEDERELSRMEADLEAKRFARFDPYDDGYRSDNSQTWDHPYYN